MATARKRPRNPNIDLGRMAADLAESQQPAVPAAVTDPAQSKPEQQYEDHNAHTVYTSNTMYTTEPAQPRPVGRPRTTVQNGVSKTKGLQPGLERYSVIAETAQLETLRDIAWNTRKTLKEIVAEAFGAYIAAADAAYKEPRPKR